MQWMQWMNKKKKQHWGNFFFYLPASIHCIVCFFFFTPLVKKWLKEWLTGEIRPLASPRAHSGTHTRTQNFKFIIHVLCERGLNVTGCYLESPISMTTGLRIRVKNCHARAIVRAPWIRGALKSEGKEERTGVEMGEFGSAGRIKGRTREWVMILANIASPPHLLSL